MTAIEAYKRFELKLNKLGSADNVDVSIGEFVLIFNEQQIKWYNTLFTDNAAQALQSPDFKLKQLSVTDRYVEYELPTNYIDYIRSHSFATKGDCKNRLILPYRIPSSDLEYHLRDENHKPSFEYQETPLLIQADKIQIYKTDFSIESVFLTYYRYPISIDIEGYIRLDGTTSTTIDPELADEQVNEILDLCALEAQRSGENAEGFQLSNDRVNRNKD